MRIIAVTGYKRHGKDTVAEYIKSKYGAHQVALAEPIKRIGQFVFGWDERHTDGELKEEMDNNGIIPREFFQWFGTEVMQYELCNRFPLFKQFRGRSIWVQCLIRKLSDPMIWQLNGTKTIVISDLRFPHEVKALKNVIPELITIKVIRSKVPWYKKIFWHESEKAVDNIKADHVLYNNGTLEDLYIKVDRAMMLMDVEGEV